MTSTNSAPLINWNQIDTVLLDMDGTLLDLHFDWHFWMEFLPQAYADKNRLTLDQAKELIHEKINAQTGTLNWYCLDYWTDVLDLPVAALKHEIKHQVKVHPEVMEFLAALKAQNKTVIMVTNAHRDSLAVKLEVTEIGDYFDMMVSSHDYGVPKEDIQVWSHLRETVHYNPNRTLLIDDNTHALSTAQTYGIRHLLCPIHVSPKLDPIDPKGFKHFSRYSEIMPGLV